jgi:predicted metal-binding protein
MGIKAGIPQDDARNPQKVVSLRLSPQYADLFGELEPLARKSEIDEMMLISTEDISVAEWVHWKCKFGCKNHGKSWCCPPETPTPEQARAILREYERAILLCGSGKHVNHYRDNHQKRRKQVHVWKSTVALERQLFLLGYYKAFALVAETCALCRECAYPHDCKFPMNRRPSVESFSIDVFQTLKNVGKRFEIAKNIAEEHNSYSIILLE